MEPQYFVMVGEGQYPVMPIDTCPELPESWRLGRVVTPPGDLPLCYVLDTDYEGQPKAIYYEQAVPVMRDDVVQVLRDAGVDNIQFADAVLINPKTGQRLGNYKAYNIVGLVSAADMGQSTFLTPPDPTEPKVNFLGLNIDERRAAGLRLFRLEESPNAVVVHVSVKDALEQSGIPGIVFYGPGTWSG
jgi:hypothetical protein